MSLREHVRDDDVNAAISLLLVSFIWLRCDYTGLYPNCEGTNICCVGSMLVRRVDRPTAHARGLSRRPVFDVANLIFLEIHFYIDCNVFALCAAI